MHGPYFLKVDLSLQDSGPFFVRAVLPNLPNPPGYGPVYIYIYIYIYIKNFSWEDQGENGAI